MIFPHFNLVFFIPTCSTFLGSTAVRVIKHKRTQYSFCSLLLKILIKFASFIAETFFFYFFCFTETNLDFLGKEVNMFISGFFLLLLFVSIFSMSEHIRIYLLVTSSYARNIFVEQTKLNSFYFPEICIFTKRLVGFRLLFGTKNAFHFKFLDEKYL